MPARSTRRFYSPRRIPTAALIIVTLVVAYYAGQALAKRPEPVAAPSALLRARAQCPDRNVTCLLSALRKAYAGLEWAQKERLSLAREMLGNVTAWTCIHNGEGAWNSNTGNGYFGGLQMDRSFMRSYGRDMIARHHGGLADTWTPREQIIVAQRAFSQNRGYNPWPNTARHCGLL